MEDTTSHTVPERDVSEAMRGSSYRIPAELADWLDIEFPHGFKQTFILQCFLSLRHVMTEGSLPPHSEYARVASVDALAVLAKGQL